MLKLIMKSVCDGALLQETMATSEELGQDLEHVELLQKKFEEFQTDLAAHEERVNEVNQLAARLVQEAHPEAQLITRKQDEVNAAWQHLKDLAQQRQAKLFGAAEVQRFNRSVVAVAAVVAAAAAAFYTTRLEMFISRSSGEYLCHL